MVKNILFICKYNRFRSKIAEYLFNKFNRNKNYKAKSAGLVKGSPLNYFQKRVCKKIGIILKDPTTGLSSKLLKWQDILIIVADDVPPSIFRESRISGKKLIVW